MSCSNDYSVKVWTVDAEKVSATCALTVAAHDSFVYSTAVIDSARWITAGEHSGVKVFKEAEVTRIVMKWSYS